MVRCFWQRYLPVRCCATDSWIAAGIARSDEMLKKNYISILWFPVSVILIACLFSIFPHYHSLFMHVIGVYIFVLFFTWIYAKKQENDGKKKKIIIFGHYLYASILIIMMIKMSFDVATYYEFTGDLEKLKTEYKNGDPQASLRLAYFYKDHDDLPRTVNRMDAFFSHEKWLRIYLRDSIRSKNTTGISDIKALAKFYIRGKDGSGYSGTYRTKLGIDLYQGADKLGDTSALLELRAQLSGAKKRMKQQIEILKQNGNDTEIRGLEKRMEDLDMVR